MTPEQEEQVRRLLAATPPGPDLPPEVADRLDATLARLVAESAAGTGGDAVPEAAPADELEARRRRRWPRVLVAAASVTVLAYGVGVVVDGMQVSGGDEAATADRGTTYTEGGGLTADSEGSSAGEQPEAAPGDDPLAGALDRRFIVDHVVPLDSATLVGDVRRLAGLDAAPLDRRELEHRDTRSYLAACETPVLAKGDRLAAVRLDGQRATLVLRGAVDGTRVAEVYSCDDATVLLARTRVPAR